MNLAEIKRSLIALLIVFILSSEIRMTDDPIQSSIEEGYSCKYFDGEGNQIPNYAVKLLVRNQFVILDKDETDTINKYFPPHTNMHECDYKNCSYKGYETVYWPKQGCGNCEQGSDCWALDSIHFRHPTLSYDECETILFNP